jgi:hypothetical protein
MSQGTHDARRQVGLLRDALQSDKVRMGFFLGAGCPSGIYDADGVKCAPLIPDVASLSAAVRQAMEAGDAARIEDERLLPCWDNLCEACIAAGVATPNVEHILTELRTITSLRGNRTIDGFAKDRLTALDNEVCRLIADSVDKGLPAHRCAYHRFASWVGGIRRLAPIDIFTPNYDLLFEEAFERQRIPHFDGFVGSREPFFDVASIEQDSIPKRWARLWKLHGSINWQLGDDGHVFRTQGRAEAGKAMIFPSHLKYDQSRRMPYLAMIDRLRAFFKATSATQGLGPPVLVVCGYSFSDDHLNEVLLDGLRGNPVAHSFVLGFETLAESNKVLEFARDQPNLTLIARDGAVVGTREAKYSEPSSAGGDPWIAHEESAPPDGTPPEKNTTCSLGDFHFFGLFLERLYGGRSSSDEHTSVD